MKEEKEAPPIYRAVERKYNSGKIVYVIQERRLSVLGIAHMPEWYYEDISSQFEFDDKEKVFKKIDELTIENYNNKFTDTPL